MAVAGTSAASGGPTGATPTTDGTVTWKYLSAVDYTSLQAWATAIPAAITQAYVGLVWNDGVIVSTPGTVLLTIASNTGSSATNTITLKTAPGESFRDKAGALGLNAANGVTIQMSGDYQYMDAFAINTPYVVFDGLQIQDPSGVSHYRLFDISAGPLTLRDCIISGQSQDSGYVMFDVKAPVTVANCVITDNLGASDAIGTFVSGNSANTVTLINSIIYCPNANTAGSALNVPGITRNSAVFGYSAPIGWGGGGNAVDHSIFDAATLSSGATINAGVLLGKAASNQYIGVGTDFRLKSGADCIDAGTADATDIPATDDAFHSVRPLGIAWDIGPFEYVPPSAVTALAISGRGTGFLARNASGNARAIAFTGAGTAGQSDRASANVPAIQFASGGVVTQTYLGSGGGTWLNIGAVGAAGGVDLASGSSSFLLISASGNMGQQDFAQGFATHLVFGASGIAATANAAYGGGTAIRFLGSGIASGSAMHGAATWLAWTPVAYGIVDDRASGSVATLMFTATGSAAFVLPPSQVSYVHFGLTPWAANTVYVAGSRVSNGGNAYLATVGGRSQNLAGAGPSGTGTIITDGTVNWTYLSRIDYTDLQSWANALPAAPTTPYTAYVAGSLNVGTAAAPVLKLTGHSTTTVNTLTIAALPGQGFRDQAGGYPLAFNAAAGASITTGTPSMPWNWIEIDDSNVTISGIQFQQPDMDGCTILQSNSPAINITVSGCLFDGYGQAGGAAILGLAGQTLLRNSLIIDRMSTAGGTPLAIYAEASVVNATVVNVNGVNSSGVISSSPGVGQVVIRNSVFSGYSAGFAENTTAGGTVVDHSVLSQSLFGTNVSDGGGNKLGTVTAFAGANDFRLAAGSAAIDAGAPDVIDVPRADDIFYTHRPEGGGWDAGAYEYIPPSLVSALVFNASGVVYAGMSAGGAANALIFTAQGTAATPIPASGEATAIQFAGSGSFFQQDIASSNTMALQFSALGYGDVPNGATGVVTYPVVTAQGTARLEAPVSGAPVALAFTARGAGNFPLAISGSATPLTWTVRGVAALGSPAAGNVNALTFGASGQAALASLASGNVGALQFGASGAAIFPNGPFGQATFLSYAGGGAATQENLGSGQAEAIGFFAHGTAGQMAFANGAATPIQFGASGQLINPFPFSGAATAIQFAATGIGGGEDRATAAPTYMSFGAAGTAALTQAASGTATALTFTGGGTALAAAVAVGNTAWFTPTAVGLAGREARAYGTALGVSLSASGVAGQEALAAGSASAFALSAIGNISLATSVHGAPTALTFTAQGTATGFALSGMASVLTFSAAGSMAFTDALAGAPVALAFTAGGMAGQEDVATGNAIALTFTARAAVHQIPTGARVEEVIYFKRDDRVIYFRR